MVWIATGKTRSNCWHVNCRRCCSLAFSECLCGGGKGLCVLLLSKLESSCCICFYSTANYLQFFSTTSAVGMAAWTIVRHHFVFTEFYLYIFICPSRHFIQKMEESRLSKKISHLYFIRFLVWPCFEMFPWMHW